MLELQILCKEYDMAEDIILNDRYIRYVLGAIFR